MPDPHNSPDRGKGYTLSQLAEILNASLVGDEEIVIYGLSTLTNAQAGQLSFLANPTYKKYLANCRASAVILRAEDAETFDGNALITTNPYLSYAKLTALFAPLQSTPAIHSSAVVDNAASLGVNVSIGANVVVEPGAIIGDACSIGPGCVIGADSVIGNESLLHANVTIYSGVRIGQRAIIQSGVVIGSDGFGYASDGLGWTKIHQLGSVVIGDDVELGAGTCIDRGALDDTVIGNGVKMDNLVQIAHNVNIGDNTLLCGCSGVAGSTSIGSNCIIGGAVGIIGHLTIVDRVTITAGTLVTKSITEPGTYSSGTPLMNNEEWRKNAATFPRLYELYRNQKKRQKD